VKKEWSLKKKKDQSQLTLKIGSTKLNHIKKDINKERATKQEPKERKTSTTYLSPHG